MNFDKKIDRRGSDSEKHNNLKEKFGSDDIIPMWVADMDFRSCKSVVKALKNRAQEGLYGYVYNDKSIYESIYKWQEKRYGWNVKKGSVFLANGVVSSIAFAIQAFTKEKDEIIIQTPVYHPFARVIKENGRKVSANSLKLTDERYEIDFKDLEKRAQKAKMLILCNPHNPTGRVFSQDELERIGQICIDNDILIISDEIHSDFVFDGKKHIPIASLSKQISKRTITLNAASKSFNVAGLMTSYVICENKKLEAIYKSYLKRFELCDNNIFGTVALRSAYESCEDWLDELVKYLQDNRDFACEFIKDHIPILDVKKPEATYLLWIDFRKLGLSPTKLEKFLVQKAKLGLNNGIIFGKEGKGFARMNLGTQRETVKEALANLKKAIDGFLAK
ncbi:MAG: pyridoxal phosphate-dependent aminotransferase [Epsilonproteobacteria bacterium]|nr:pyridoxal phosphate-dependent aminotransferase [Campylobacterota bacterium]